MTKDHDEKKDHRLWYLVFHAADVLLCKLGFTYEPTCHALDRYTRGVRILVLFVVVGFSWTDASAHHHRTLGR